MNTYEALTLNDGTEVKLTLTFARLLRVKNENKNLYEKCNDVLMNGAKDIFQMIDFIYVAYMCANLDNFIAYENFIDLVPFDLKKLAQVSDNLMTSKKK